MNYRKIALYLIAAVIGISLWNAWTHQFPQQTQQPNQAATTSTNSDTSSGNAVAPAPFVSSQQQSTQPTSTPQPQPSAPNHDSAKVSHHSNWISVKTDVQHLMIDPQGGNIVSALLPQYPVSVKQKDTPIQILSPAQDTVYLAQSGLTTSGENKPIVYTSAKRTYRLADGQKQLVVTLSGSNRQGLQVTKSYSVDRGSYAINVKTTIRNAGGQTWKGSLYNQFTRRNVPVSRSFHSRSYDGAAISTSDVPYKQYKFRALAEQNISQNVKNGWIAMQQPYFLSAWVPRNQKMNHYYSTSTGNGDDGEYNVFQLGYVTPEVAIKPGQTIQDESTLYVGPEIAQQLNTVAPHLNLTIDYGWLAPISILIFTIMRFIHDLIGNWGWSIVLVTIFIKIIFYPFSAKSLKSMAKLRLLQPKFQALKERFGDDKQAMGKATMEIYKKEKVNPMSGCLPMIIQVPVFFALYYVLIESVQLRQAPFIFWIHDLSVKDPYYVLPILMGISMFLQQKMNPPPPDPTQAKMMMFLPVIFTVFFLSFPAGLVLYWLTNNCVQTLHQYYVLKTYDAKKEDYRKRKKKKKK